MISSKQLNDAITGIDDKYLLLADSGATDIGCEKVRAKYYRQWIKVAAIFAGIIILLVGVGNITSYATTGKSIIGVFFKSENDILKLEAFNSDFTLSHKEGRHTFIVDCVLYDDELGVGYISITAEDNNGENKPISISYASASRDYTETIYLFSEGDEVVLILSSFCAAYTYTESECCYVKFMSRKNAENDFVINGGQLGMCMISADDYNKLYKEINSLVITDSEYVEKAEKIFDKYGMTYFDCSGIPVQTIENKYVEAYIGRTDILVIIDTADKHNITLVRENGTEFPLMKDGAWLIKEYALHIGDSIDNDNRRIYEASYGFVLGEDEKINLVVDGVMYE